MEMQIIGDEDREGLVKQDLKGQCENFGFQSESVENNYAI